MKIFVLLLFQCVLLDGKLLQGPLSYVQNLRTNKFIIDTDAGSDDAVAIFLALSKMFKENNTQVLGITCVGGNTIPSQVAINVLKILRVGGYGHIPVYIGSNTAIIDNLESDGYFGKDGFGDVPFPDPPKLEDASKEHAVLALLRMVTEHPGQITLVALGSLTNVAIAIRIDPLFRTKLRSLIWMGSNYLNQRNSAGNIEFNAKTDPEADYIVFNSEGPPIIVVPFEVDKVWAPLNVTWRIDVLGKQKGPVIKFLNAIEQKVLVPGKLWPSVDSKTLSIALDSSIITNVTAVNVTPIIRDVKERGVFLYKDVDANNTENAIVVTGFDLKKYIDLLFKYLPT